jgi:Gpi18-like mannosyltransferase
MNLGSETQSIMSRSFSGKPALVRIMKRLEHSAFAYVLFLFTISRTLYLTIGFVSIRRFDRFVPAGTTTYATKISSHLPIQMWYIWDSVNYGNLARQYSASLAPLHAIAQRGADKEYYLLHWFPLYPLTIKAVHGITHLSIPYSQLLISNVAFIVAMYLLYKLMRVDENHAFARTVVAFLVLLPTSFLFSSALSEALFLALAIAAIYYARTQRWIWAGVMGFLLALTHAQGFLIAIPLAVEAIQQYGIPRKITRELLMQYIKPVTGTFIAVCGLFLFMFYCWLRTKNLFAYIDSQFAGTGLALGNPFMHAYENFFRIRTIIILSELAMILLAIKRLRWSYTTYAIIFTLVTLGVEGKTAGIGSSLRYMAIVFPVAIAAGYLARVKWLTNPLWITFGILNGTFFILWVNWWTRFII